MSVYSGFPSRAQEESYNRAVYNMLCLLQIKVTRTMRNGMYFLPLIYAEQFDDGLLLKYFTRFYKKMRALEESKHFPPKFSFAVKDLAEYYRVLDQPLTNNQSSMESLSSHFSFNQFQNSPLKDEPKIPPIPPKEKITVRVPLRRGPHRSKSTVNSQNSSVVININKNYNIGLRRCPHNTPALDVCRSRSVARNAKKSFTSGNTVRGVEEAYGLGDEKSGIFSSSVKRLPPIKRPGTDLSYCSNAISLAKDIKAKRMRYEKLNQIKKVYTFSSQAPYNTNEQIKQKRLPSIS